MSAALRYAARRAVGGRALQRTRAAVEEEQRRRLVHSVTPLSFPRASPFSTASRSSTKGLASENEGQIKKMKEELYTAIAEQEKNNTIYDSLVSPNVGLLENLSVQLDPKHNDPRCLQALISTRKKDQRLPEVCRDIFSHYYGFGNTVWLVDGI
ncbi:hypothetical protein ACQJBY_063611 [Aegilops geniculata]